MRTLCALLGALLDSPPLRQSALIVLAASCELVPRLWFSHLKVMLLLGCPHATSARAALHSHLQGFPLSLWWLALHEVSRLQAACAE